MSSSKFVDPRSIYKIHLYSDVPGINTQNWRLKKQTCKIIPPNEVCMYKSNKFIEDKYVENYKLPMREEIKVI